MLIGYARVSTTDQNLSLQKDALEKAGCERIYEDELSGTKDNRPGLLKALEMLRENDTLVVWKLDRLGRSVKSLIELVSELNSKNVHFKSLTDSIDTSTPSGRFFFHVCCYNCKYKYFNKNKFKQFFFIKNRRKYCRRNCANIII